MPKAGVAIASPAFCCPTPCGPTAVKGQETVWVTVDFPARQFFNAKKRIHYSTPDWQKRI